MKIDKKKREAAIRAARNLDEQTREVRDLERELQSAIDAADKTYDRMIAALRDAGLEVEKEGEGYGQGGYVYNIDGEGYGVDGEEFESELECALKDDEDEQAQEVRDRELRLESASDVAVLLDHMLTALRGSDLEVERDDEESR